MFIIHLWGRSSTCGFRTSLPLENQCRLKQLSESLVYEIFQCSNCLLHKHYKQQTATVTTSRLFFSYILTKLERNHKTDSSVSERLVCRNEWLYFILKFKLACRKKGTNLKPSSHFSSTVWQVWGFPWQHSRKRLFLQLWPVDFAVS